MEKITLPINLINGVLQYLGTRPYGEVFQIIEAIQKEAKEQIPVEMSNEVTSG
jgi:hypothetical protein